MQLRICIRSGAGQRATRPRSAVGAGRRALDRGQLGQLRGSASEGKKRWCSGCAEGHAGAVGVKAKTIVRGLPAEAANLWAAGGREEAVVLRQCKSSEGSWSNNAADACSDHGCDCAGGHRDGSDGDGNDTGGC